MLNFFWLAIDAMPKIWRIFFVDCEFNSITENEVKEKRQLIGYFDVGDLLKLILRNGQTNICKQ